MKLWVTLGSVIIMVLCCIASPPGSCTALGYSPLEVAPESKPLLVELNVMDQARGRDIPLHVFLPAVKTPAPVILFSHGLGGSGREYTYLGELWAARGYAVIFIQHRGSDISVWQDKAPQMRLEALKKAASLSNFLLRVKDVSVVLDKLASLNASSDNVLSGRLDLSRVGMAGHSFGAITTQAVSGQNTGFDSISFIDSRIKAALIMSPSKGQQLEPSRSFGSVKIPWMIMTGTYDLVPDLGQADMESRLAVFSALPPGGKYELVLFNAEHSVFTDRALPGDSRPRNPNHHHAILALSSAFWDAWLRNDAQAKSWLDGDGPGTVLEAKDHWQRK